MRDYLRQRNRNTHKCADKPVSFRCQSKLLHGKLSFVSSYFVKISGIVIVIFTVRYFVIIFFSSKTDGRGENANEEERWS